MRVVYYLDSDTLIYGPDDGLSRTLIQVACRVRNEVNGKRPLDSKPVYTKNADGSDGVPYMPRPFPKGEWEITSYAEKEGDEMGPGLIRTNARQLVDEWTEVGGHYGQKTGRKVWDYGYGFHNSIFVTTLGCGRILGELDGRTRASTKEQKEFSDAVVAALARGEKIPISVV